MNLKEGLKLNSGWGWGIVGFIISMLISWMAPFGKVPRLFFQRAYERVEIRLVQAQVIDGMKVHSLRYEKLLDYPEKELDFKGSVVIKNNLSTDCLVDHVTMEINGKPVRIRLWDSPPDRLAFNEEKEFVFYTDSIPTSSTGHYTLTINATDMLGRTYSTTREIKSS